MDDLRTPGSWSPEDDAFLRGALLTLRTDVEAAPLPHPEQVRARGDSLRRRRAIAYTAAVAAAAIIVAALGFRGLGREDAAPPPLPATQSPTPTSPTPTPTPTPTTSSPSPTTTPSRPTRTASSTPTPTSPRPTTSTGRPSARPSPTSQPSSPPGEALPVVHWRGSGELPASRFLPASVWQDAGVAGTHEIVSEWPPEAEFGALSACDVKADVDNAGITHLKDTTTDDFVGSQRIQTSNFSSDGDTNDSEPDAAVRATLADRSCADRGVVDRVEGPRPGTVAVVFDYGYGRFTDYLGYVAMRGDRNTATISLNARKGTPTAAAWDQLGRLMDAAAQR